MAERPFWVAVQKYTSSEWTVLFLLWVVSVCGLINKQSLHDTLDFLAVPCKQWSLVTHDSVCGSIEALAFM